MSVRNATHSVPAAADHLQITYMLLVHEYIAISAVTSADTSSLSDYPELWAPFNTMRQNSCATKPATDRP